MLSIDNSMQSVFSQQQEEEAAKKKEEQEKPVVPNSINGADEGGPHERMSFEEINNENLENPEEDIPGILTFLQTSNVPEPTLKLVNNVLRTIALLGNPKDSMFLFYLLSRYANISQSSKNSLVNKVPLLDYMNILLFRGDNYGILAQATSLINAPYVPPKHGILITNYVKDSVPIKQSDYMYHNEDYGYLLLFTLLSVPNYKTKDEVLTLDNISYLAKIFEGLKTKQNT